MKDGRLGISDAAISDRLRNELYAVEPLIVAYFDGLESQDPQEDDPMGCPATFAGWDHDTA